VVDEVFYDGLTPDDAITQAYQSIDAALRENLLAEVLDLSPTRFEQLIVDLLLAMGYGGGDREMGRALGKSGDGGIDGVINEDKLGLDAVYIQAKRYAPENTVGRPAIQSFIGSLTGEGATKGVFVTTSSYSKEARAYVDRIAQRVVLIDGDRLARLMISHDVGVRIRHTYHIRSIDEDYFTET
jgi:restriction system protein